MFLAEATKLNAVILCGLTVPLLSYMCFVPPGLNKWTRFANRSTAIVVYVQHRRRGIERCKPGLEDGAAAF